MCLICGKQFQSTSDLRDHAVRHVQTGSDNTPNLFEENRKYFEKVEKEHKTVIKTEPCDDIEYTTERVYSPDNEAQVMIKADPDEFDSMGEFNDSEDSISNTNEAFNGGNVGAMWDDVYRMIQAYDNDSNIKDETTTNRDRFTNILNRANAEVNKAVDGNSAWEQKIQQ